MISVLVYGRNDSYGYNLHKRAAISFNTIAALLEGDDDEIVFVDYNTPDDFPTFPEAIRDTLTEQARRHLRVLRVRPALHRRKSDAESLAVIEPLARNIGLRRTNPLNRWVLSTNTDIILGMRGQESLKAMLGGLGPGFYQAPRVEIPETVWEGFDRSQPQEILGAMRWLAPALHLDEIVYGNDSVMFDGPGDFQLIERDVLFALDGFHERMDKGWHVDANLSVRMTLHYGAISSLEDRVFAYHCDHTRQVTPLHKPESLQNDLGEFVDNVSVADIPEQRETWGAAGEEIEELRLDDSQSRQYLYALKTAIGAPQVSPMHSAYRHDSYDSFDYDPRHVMPFLADLVSSAPRTLRLGWAGFRDDTRTAFETAWRELGFSERIRNLNGGGPNALELWLADCDMFVFDFGSSASGKPISREQRSVMGEALHAVRNAENLRIGKGSAPRRIVGIDVLHNRFESAFKSAVAAASTPYSTRLRAGFVRPEGERVDWLALADPRKLPISATTQGLMPGRHFLRVRLGTESHNSETHEAATITVRVLDGGVQLAAWQGRAGPLTEQPITIPFDVESSQQAVTVSVALDSALVPRLSALWSGPEFATRPSLDLPEAMVGHDRDWLSFCHIGKAGIRSEGGVEAVSGKSGHVIFGPYWPLPPGSYAAQLDISGGKTNLAKALTSRRPMLIMDVRTTDAERLARKFIMPSKNDRKIALPFTVEGAHLAFPLEVRLYTSGASQFTIRRLTVDRL
jgi:hypothetical protein